MQATAETLGMRHIVQVYREGDVGAAAAKALHDEIASHGLATIERPLTPRASDLELAAALEKAGTKDAIVLWLRPEDLSNLPAPPPKRPLGFVRRLVGGLGGA